MTDIVAELRRKIGDRDGDDGVIGVTFGEMRSLLDAIDTLRWYADEGNYDEYETPGVEVRTGKSAYGFYLGYDWKPDEGKRARAALAALERSDE